MVSTIAKNSLYEFVNIPRRKEEGSYAYYFGVGGTLHLLRYPVPPTTKK
jgi:hypothetical protein